MALQVQDQGRYILFQTYHGNRILALNERRFFAWILGGRSQFLVSTDPDHERARVLQSGRFFLVRMDQAGRLGGGPHLILENRRRYRLYPLPDGLPSPDGFQSPILMEASAWSHEEIARLLEGERGPNGHPNLTGSAAVTYYLRGIRFPNDGPGLVAHARDQGAPPAVLTRLDDIGDARPTTMADVLRLISRAAPP